MFRPKALSERSMVCRVSSGSRAVRSEDSAGGISESKREVKISARLAMRSEGFDLRMEARCSQAPGPRVLPPRRISAMVVDSTRAAR